jgi:hypothetical protein
MSQMNVDYVTLYHYRPNIKSLPCSHKTTQNPTDHMYPTLNSLCHHSMPTASPVANQHEEFPT